MTSPAGFLYIKIYYSRRNKSEKCLVYMKPFGFVIHQERKEQCIYMDIIRALKSIRMGERRKSKVERFNQQFLYLYLHLMDAFPQ